MVHTPLGISLHNCSANALLVSWPGEAKNSVCYVQRDCRLEGLKIKKIQRIRKVTQKRLYALLINVRGMIEQLMLNLHLLSGGQSAEFVDSIEGNDAHVIVLQLR